MNNTQTPDTKNILTLLKKKEKSLSPLAANAFESEGRENFEVECEYRTPFQRDRDRILHSKAFRRLKRKTQVFFAPKNDHLRTRLTHTLEVAQISRTISRILNLNEDLTEAIAMGHDLGHTPFGHWGEQTLNKISQFGFSHNVHSVRVVKHIEKLNLCTETIDGILNHTGSVKPFTLEGQVVKISDRIAYLNHDLEDAVRARIVRISSIPKEFGTYFGSSKRERIKKVVQDIYINSFEQNSINMSEDCVNFLNNFRSWMFKNVYFNDITKERELEAKGIVRDLFNYYNQSEGEQLAIDYVAGMSDEFAIETHKSIFKVEERKYV